MGITRLGLSATPGANYGDFTRTPVSVTIIAIFPFALTICRTVAFDAPICRIVGW